MRWRFSNGAWDKTALTDKLVSNRLSNRGPDKRPQFIECDKDALKHLNESRLAMMQFADNRPASEAFESNGLPIRVL